MKRGVVISIDKKVTTVMTADGQFVRVPLQGSPDIGEEILFEEEFRRPASSRTVYRYAAAAALTGILLTACLLYALSQLNPVVAYLTMDINPSIEMGVDEDSNVRTLRALNADGERLIDGFHYKGMDVDAAALYMLQRAADEHYLDEPHRDILITSVLMRERRTTAELESRVADGLRERLNDMMKQQLPDKEVTITTLSAPKELRDEAAANGISTGKMAVYLMAKDEGYQLQMDEVKTQSIDKVTEPMGGLQQVVATEQERSSNAKEKLRQLLDEEREKAGKGKSKSALQETIEPTKKPREPQSTPKPENTKKPTVKPTVNPTKVPTAKPPKKPQEEGKGKPSSRPITTPDGRGNGKGQNADDDRKQGNNGWRDKGNNKDDDLDDDDADDDADDDDDRDDDDRNDKGDWDDRDDGDDRDDDVGKWRDDRNDRADKNNRNDRKGQGKDGRDSDVRRDDREERVKRGNSREADDWHDRDDDEDDDDRRKR